MQSGKAIPTDWTGGTGVFPSGGVIDVPAEPQRNSILIQNQDVDLVTIGLSATTAAGAACTANVVLGAGASADTEGGTFNFGTWGFLTNAAFTVTGTAGKQVCVITN